MIFAGIKLRTKVFEVSLDLKNIQAPLDYHQIIPLKHICWGTCQSISGVESVHSTCNGMKKVQTDVGKFGNTRFDKLGV